MKLHKEFARLFGWELLHARKEQPTLENHLKQLLPRLGIGCVLDVGANQGQYGTMLRRAGYRGRIVSFEPVQATFALLKTRAAHDPEWHVYDYALGTKREQRTIHVTRATVLSSFREPNAYSREQYAWGMPIVGEEEVQIRTLDEVFAEVTAGLTSPKLFLKLDTQGFDLQVFAGATRVLPEVIGLQTEVSIQPIYEGVPDYLEALAVYTKAGFTVSGLYPVSRDRSTLALIEMDCVMRRVEKPAQKKAVSPAKKVRKKAKK